MRNRILALSVSLFLSLQGTGLGQDSEAASAYHFPRFTGATGSEITIVNPGQTIAEAQIQFFTEEGLPTVRFVTLLPTNQLRLSGSELGVGSTGALTVSSATALQVTVALGGGAEQAVGPGEAGADIVVPFAHGTRGKTSLDVFNPGRNEARVFVIAVSPEGTALGASDFFLPPHGSFHGDISELVGQAVLPPNDVSHLLVRAPTNVFQVRREVVASALIQEYSNVGADVTTRTDAALSSGNSEATRNSAIRLPLFVDNAGFFSLLQVINTSPSLQSITLRALSEESKLVSGSQNPASITLGAGASIRENVGKIFGFEDGTVAMGSIVVEGSQSLDAVVALGNTLGTNLVVVGGRPVLGDNDFVFNTRAIDREVYDGITLVNPHSFNADVLFSVMRADGSRLSQATLTVPPFQQTTNTLSELIPEIEGEGFVVVQSVTPIIPAAITGRTDSSGLSNLPFTPAPAGIQIPPQEEFLAVGSVFSGGAPIPGASVLLSGPVSGVIVADSSGSYAFRDIPAGAYTLTAGATGFALTPSSIDISIVDSNSRDNNFEGTLIVPEIESVTPPPGGPGRIRGNRRCHIGRALYLHKPGDFRRNAAADNSCRLKHAQDKTRIKRAYTRT